MMMTALAVHLLLAASSPLLAQSTNVDLLKAREKLAAYTPDRLPPSEYVAEGVCPSECCRYGAWTVLADADLLDSPGGRVAGRLKAGEKVKALGGQVRTHPRPYLVLGNHAPFKAGDIVFAVYYVGEGVLRYWKDGNVVETGQSDVDLCDQPGTDCWAAVLDRPFDASDRVWWANLKKSDGRAGWSTVDAKLKPIDDCE